MGEEARYIPVDPQTFLVYVEEIERMQGRTINMEVHGLLMVGISQAIAAMEFEEVGSVSPQWFLDRVTKWLEHLVTEVQTVRGVNQLRVEIQYLRQATQQWREHFESRERGSSDTGLP